MSPFNIVLTSQKVARFLASIVFLLVALFVSGQVMFYFLPDFPLRDFIAWEFNLDLERNIPALFSVFLLLLSAWLLGYIAKVQSQRKDRFCRYWRGLSFIFLYLALDEFLAIHERLIPIFWQFGATGFFYFGWVIVGKIFVALVALIYARFLFALPPQIRKLFFLAGATYVSGTILTEMIAGKYASLYGNENFIYMMIVAFEEMMEMLGLVIFIYALVSFIAFINAGEVNLQVLPNQKQRSKVLLR